MRLAPLSVHASHQAEFRSAAWAVFLFGLVCLALPFVPATRELQGLANYLPLHSLMETMAVVVAGITFAIAWHTPQHQSTRKSVVVGCVFLGVALLDFSHMISYAGMPDFVTPSSPAKGIHFWLAARAMAAVGLVVAALLPGKQVSTARLRLRGLVAVLTVVVGVHLAVLYAPASLPEVFVEGRGLTPFKVHAEYVLIAAYLLAALLFVRRLGRPREAAYSGFAAAALIMAMSEFLFTLYADVADLYNLAGHVYKIAAYYFLYRALFVESLLLPYERLDESLAELQTTLQALPDLLFEVDADGRFLSVNTGQSHMLVMPPEAFLGRTITEVLPAGAASVGMEAIREALREGSSRGRQYQLALPGGHLWFELSVARKPQLPGFKPQLIVISRDITSRVQYERALKQTAQLNASLLALPDASDFRQPVQWMDVVMRQAMGVTASAVGFFALVDADGACLELACWAGPACPMGASGGPDAGSLGPGGAWALAITRRAPVVFDIGQEPTGDLGLPSELGRIDRWLSVPVYDGGALRMVAGVGNALDPYAEADAEAVRLLADGALRIAQKRAADKQLVRLSTAVAQSPNPIVITDLQANIEYVNEAFTRVTGYGAQEVMGRNPRLLRSGKTPPATYRQMWAALAKGNAWHGEFINRNKAGDEYFEKSLIFPVRDVSGKVTHYLAHKEDVTASKAANERILYLSQFDQLTGLPNRVALEERLRLALVQAARLSYPLALVWLDLDFFKEVNESLGHATGDLLLREVTHRIRSVVPEHDTVARVSGDKFAIVLTDLDQNGAARVASELMRALAVPLVLGGCELVITASIGLSLFPEDGRSVEDLLRSAEVAMYRVKNETRNGFRFYAPGMQERTARALQLTNALKLALARDELRLVYQPQVSLVTGELVGAEALLRWRNPQLGDVPPAEFIPLAEGAGLIGAIGEWVLRQALRQLHEWLRRELPVVKVAINLSPVQIYLPQFVSSVAQCMQACGVPGRLLELELTEAAAMRDADHAQKIMGELSGLGLALSIDDFGTGYSSLSHLKRFSSYKLKIDQSFVRNVVDDADDQAIVQAIIQMAHSLGMVTLAEGVETPQQAAFLRRHGCDEMQGYHYSHPLEVADFERFLSERPRLPPA